MELTVIHIRIRIRRSSRNRQGAVGESTYAAWDGARCIDYVKYRELLYLQFCV